MKNKLPECQLVETIKRKSDARNDIEFDYVTELNNLRHRISGEVRFINELFPEYTPHDEEYHLSRLFHVADTLIESSRYEDMNVTELFVLACGLYGHDWGMAVSNAERDYIISSVPPDGFVASDFALLHDEHGKFAKFINERGLTLEDIKETGIQVEDWRDYVRNTHAFRSGVRMRNYFQNIDSGVGEAAGRVCEGHWLNIEDLENYRKYPLNFAVLRENLNLAALAIYVRLVDLFDIGHDRTPYVIWKFVAPRDRYSKMEWSKHRALQPITCPPYQKGRVIMVDGSTDDHEVYAALEDLHNYCEKQMRECMNLLAQIGDPKHFLELYHLDWRVVARGFDPVLIRFEFHRDRVFDILSDEIYQGDPYVFLRELLQNSIDAIRFRRELLQRAGIHASDYGLIHIDVEHKTNGDARIICTDDGVGMDAHIVRNYLAVAGKSYYRSEEFEKQGLSFDPISKFGIGILSCFMVADLVEIETCRDPYAKPSSRALRIKIPAVNRQFRIEQPTLLDFGIGTRVVVHVEGRKLPAETKRLEVTRYLKIIAGFIEFPIIISEDDHHTVVAHPDSQIDPSVDGRFTRYRDVEIFKLNVAYPFDEVFLLQDVDKAKIIFTEQKFNMSTDLGLSGYEGFISFAVAQEFDWIETYYHNVGQGILVERGGQGTTVRWNQEWAEPSLYSRPTFSRSASPALSYSVYRKGILVPQATQPFNQDELDRRQHWPSSHLAVNIWASDGSQPDIARVDLKGGDDHWFEPIRRALQTKLQNKLRDSLDDSDSFKTLSNLGGFSLMYRTTADFILESDYSGFPIAALKSEGQIHVIKWQKLLGNSIQICPEVLEREVMRLLISTVEGKPYEGYLKNWRGHDVFIFDGYLRELRIERAIIINRILLEHLYHPSAVVFLKSPVAGSPPLVQQIWEPKEQSPERSIEMIAEHIIEEPQSVLKSELATFLRVVRPYTSHYFLTFPTHETTAFRVGSTLSRRVLFNLRHPVVGGILKSMAWLFLTKKEKADINKGLLSDSLSKFFDSRYTHEELTAAANSMSIYAPQVGLNLDSLATCTINKSEIWHESPDAFDSLAQKNMHTFGQLLKS